MLTFPTTTSSLFSFLISLLFTFTFCCYHFFAFRRFGTKKTAAWKSDCSDFFLPAPFVFFKRIIVLQCTRRSLIDYPWSMVAGELLHTLCFFANHFSNVERRKIFLPACPEGSSRAPTPSTKATPKQNRTSSANFTWSAVFFGPIVPLGSRMPDSLWRNWVWGF